VPFAETAGARISFTVHQPEEAGADPQSLLLIMGLAGSGAMWWRLVPHVRRRHRVIVFDNRGTGASSSVHRPLTMRDLAADAVAVLDAADAGQAHVVGASMGGMIAQHLALDHRPRVRSLTLACTTAGGRAGAPNPRLMGATLLRPLLGPGRTWPLVVPALYSPSTRAHARDRLAEDLDRRRQDRVGPLTPWAQMAAIAGHDTRTRLAELAGLPTLVLHGGEDRLVPIAHGRELARAIPGARFVELPDAGHMLLTDAEDAVVAAILEHVEGNRADTARRDAA